MEEVYVDVFGLEEFFMVSNKGNVIRKERIQSMEGYTNKNGTLVKSYEVTLPEMKMIGYINGSGYHQVNLRKDGKRFNKYVHVLMYESFNKIAIPEGFDVNHIDHDKNNNTLENLELITHKENMRKMVDFYHAEGTMNKRYDKENYCLDCNSQITLESNRCRSCAGKYRDTNRKVLNRPSKENLYGLLKENSFTFVAGIFGVSDNAVRKWCKSYDIPSKSSYYRGLTRD